jgi:hypothetical protein
MLFVDGAGYSWRGVAGSYTADAAVTMLSCGLLAALLIWLTRKNMRPLAAARTTS